jgi:hypothetical protein
VHCEFSHLNFKIISGYTDVLKGFVRLGLLSPHQHPALHSQVSCVFYIKIDH